MPGMDTARADVSRADATRRGATDAAGRGASLDPRAAVVSFADVSVVRDDQVLLLDATGSARAGQVLAVVGPNGSGKTTLLRVIAGMLAPSAGEVHVLGRVPDDRDRAFRGCLAALIGAPQTARDLTVAEHLQFIAATWGADLREAQRTATDLLAELAIEPLAARYPHELSSGQSQLVALALTLARPAQALLLDEPEQRLDADRLELVISAVAARARAGAAVLLASHSPRVLAALADDELRLDPVA